MGGVGPENFGVGQKKRRERRGLKVSRSWSGSEVFC